MFKKEYLKNVLKSYKNNFLPVWWNDEKYKLEMVKKVSEVLDSNYIFKSGQYENNIRNFYKLYDEICEELKNETEIVEIFKSQLDKNCYPDPELKTLTQDVGFFIERKN